MTSPLNKQPPSKVLSLRMNGRTEKAGEFNFEIVIPEEEASHIQEVITEQEYAVLPLRSHGGPLTAVDIGAHVGLFTLYCKITDPQSQVHCFEPAPATLDMLKKNTATLSGVQVHPFALSDFDGEASLGLHGKNTGENSIRMDAGKYAESVSVPVKHAGRCLDELKIGHIDILKIDTEGSEVNVLKALGSRLDDVDYVVLEYHREWDRREIDRLLENFYLFSLKTTFCALGTAKYIHKRLAEPALNPALKEPYRC